jgi:tyrosyl-tRNA synthetase
MGKYLKMFTLLSPSHIASIVERHSITPESRTAQHLLAKEVVTLIHGETTASKAEIQTRLLFPAGSETMSLSARDILHAFGDETVVDVPKMELVGEMVSKVMRKVGAVRTRSEADNVIRGGGVYHGQSGERVQDIRACVTEEWLLDGEVLLLKIGKGKFTVIRAA